MSLLLSQPALDSLLCHCCHKYLSVTPIKVFPNRRIKCGRCFSPEDKSGFLSMYNEVAKRSIFKCINHYEGCKALLNTTEVLQHEAICKSKEYVCSVCNNVFPSYLIYNHFTKKHEELVLKKTYFVIKQSAYTTLHFLYRYDEDFLLFVKYAHEMLPYDDLTKASINFSLIGDSKTVGVLNLDLVLIFGKTTIEEKVNCEVFPSESKNDLRMIGLDLKEINLVVGFLLELPESDVNLRMADIAMNKGIEYLSELILSHYFKNRVIYLDNCVENKLSNGAVLRKKDWSYGTISTLKGNNIELTYFIYFCEKMVYWRNCTGASYFENVSYFSKWKCGSHIPSVDLHQHENDCENQIPQPCPVEFCKHRCKSFEIEHHFNDEHPQLHTPVFYDFGNNYLLLSPSDSPIYRVFVVSNISIVMELIWTSPFWEITLTCKIVNSRPRMVILNSSGGFLTFIKETGSCLNYYDKMKYFCYLADPEKEEFNEINIG